MAEWVHCNKCAQRYRSKMKFFLSECGHVICEKCHEIMVSNSGKCIVCANIAKTLLLSSDISYDVQCFFKPFPTAIDTLKQIYEFQHKNEMSLTKDLDSKYKYARQEVVKSFKVVQELKKENHRLKALLNNMQKPPFGSRATSTPLANACGPSPISSTLSVSTNNFKFMASPAMGINGNDSFKRPGYAQRTSFRNEVSMDTVNTPSPASSIQVVPGARRFAVPKVHGPQKPFLNFPPQMVRGDKRPA